MIRWNCRQFFFFFRYSCAFSFRLRFSSLFFFGFRFLNSVSVFLDVFRVLPDGKLLLFVVGVRIGKCFRGKQVKSRNCSQKRLRRKTVLDTAGGIRFPSSGGKYNLDKRLGRE